MKDFSYLENGTYALFDSLEEMENAIKYLKAKGHSIDHCGSSILYLNKYSIGYKLD